jgi:hypothetical protein
VARTRNGRNQMGRHRLRFAAVELRKSRLQLSQRCGRKQLGRDGRLLEQKLQCQGGPDE